MSDEDIPAEVPPVPVRAAPKQDDGPAPEFELTLADGRTVPGYGAIPTHVAVGDQAVRVVSVERIPR